MDDIEEKRQEISDMLNDLTDEQVVAMWKAMHAQDAARWVIRTENGLHKWRLKEPQALIGEPTHLFWNPSNGWMRTIAEAKQYTTKLGAKRAVAYFRGRGWDSDRVEVVRVTP